VEQLGWWPGWRGPIWEGDRDGFCALNFSGNQTSASTARCSQGRSCLNVYTSLSRGICHGLRRLGMFRSGGLEFAGTLGQAAPDRKNAHEHNASHDTAFFSQHRERCKDRLELPELRPGSVRTHQIDMTPTGKVAVLWPLFSVSVLSIRSPWQF